MALRRKEKPVPRPPLLASAARWTFGGAQSWQGLPKGDRRWQIEAWRHYDICGELRFATGWKANACTRAIMYVADVDPDTGEPVGPTDNPDMIALGQAVFGRPAQRAKHIRACELNLQIAGEVYIIIRAVPPIDGVPQPDEWITLSNTELSEQGGRVEFTSPTTGLVEQLNTGDTVIRIYTSHPQIQLAADSTVRALLPTLREIEKTSQNIAARLDSRLASAGAFIVPLEADMPQADGDAAPEETPTLTQQIFESMQASLREPGSAGAQVPLIFNVPADAASAFKRIDFESPLNREVIDLRESALARLAAGIDLPREVIEGMGASNHWSAWQVSEETYRTHIAPDLGVIADGLTEAWLIPMARARGVANPELYMIAFDGGPLVSEPDPIDRVMTLFNAGLITAEAALQMLHIPDDYYPDDDQRLHALALQLITAQPKLYEEPSLRKLLGIEDMSAPETPPLQPVAAPPAGNGPPAITAAAGGVPSGDFTAADIAVRYALERAGNRLLNTQRRKADYANHPRESLHVQLRPDPAQHAALLDGAWRHVGQLAIRYGLHQYAEQLIDLGVEHSSAMLADWMARYGE